jgi:hypothetical protein
MEMHTAGLQTIEKTHKPTTASKTTTTTTPPTTLRWVLVFKGRRREARKKGGVRDIAALRVSIATSPKLKLLVFAADMFVPYVVN